MTAAAGPACDASACARSYRSTTQQEEALADYDITPKELNKMLQEHPGLYVLDVREPHEIAICAIEGTFKIPLGEIASRFSEVPKHEPVVVHCKLGGRSAQAVEFLKSKGHENVKNLSGGIIRWIDEVDNSLNRY